MQRNLNIDIKHTPIYWPQANGLLERNHRSLKDSIKAQLVDLGEKHQDKWIHYLPWALLGRRTAYNEDLGTSSSELTFGKHISIPGSLLPDAPNQEPDVDSLLKHLRIKDNRKAVPTSTTKQNYVSSPPESVTHVYTRQHDTKGPQTRYKGPFLIVARPSRSTIEIKVGLNKDGSNRTELRSWSDVKSAYLRENVIEAERPKRGRPPLRPNPGPAPSVSEKVTSDESKQIDDSQPFHGFRPFDVSQIDFSKPPPNFSAGNSKTHRQRPDNWSATPQQIEDIQRSIDLSTRVV